MVQKLKNIFSVDLRALALMRIGIALIIIADLSIRLLDLGIHYTDQGILPLSALMTYRWNIYYFSIFTFGGSKGYILFLFCLNYVWALMLLFGYRTRIANFLCWIFLLSLHNRNPLILQAGDDLLRLLLFWGLFLPWNKRYSVDSERKDYGTANKYFSPSAVAYILQVISVYFFTALFKHSAEWSVDGTAVYYALSLDQMVYPLGKLIYPYKGLLKFLTFSTYYMELLLPFVLLIPFYVSKFRWIFIVIIFCFQMGIGLTMNVGLFYIINIVSLLGMIPSGGMDWLDRKLKIIRGKSEELLEEKSFPVNAAVIFFTIYCFVWNMGTLPMVGYALDERTNWIGSVLRIDQSWGMFAPTVFKDDGWFIFEARKKDGDWIDIKAGGRAITYNKPDNIYALFGRDRWRKYYENFLFVSNDWMRPFYCNYVRTNWNKENPTMQIDSLHIVYMKEVTAPDYKYVKPKREILSTCW